jgi:hypothetical protein
MIHYLDDLCAAAPAAVARILLGHRTDPSTRFLFTVMQKLSALVGALCFAVMSGQLARSFSSTEPYAVVIVIAAAFMSQELAVALIKRGKKQIKQYEND